MSGRSVTRSSRKRSALVMAFLDSRIPLKTRASNDCFFFQAEDGIRDVAVTGVQTCALPILLLLAAVSITMYQALALIGMLMVTLGWPSIPILPTAPITASCRLTLCHR